MSEEINESTCNKTDAIAKNIKANKDLTTASIAAIHGNLKSTGSTAFENLNKLKEKKVQHLNAFQTKIDKIKNFLKPAARAKRPDLTFLLHILIFITALIIVYKALPFVTGSLPATFNNSQFLKATKLPESAFNLEETSKVNVEIKAFTDHSKYFDDGGAYAPANAGVYDITKSSSAMPMIVFFLSFVLPPIAIGYVLWFIYTYYKYVISAAWGWFIAMYSYFTTLIQGKLGCKWYIKMVTGWRCRSPKFSDYVETWRKKYVDVPVYYEKLKYIKEYHDAKAEYVTGPYKIYISDPYDRALIKTEFAERVYIDRTVEILLKKIRDGYQYGAEIFHWPKLLGKTYGKVFKNNLTSSSFNSKTITGKTCTCPSQGQIITDKVSRINDNVQNISKDATDKIKDVNLKANLNVNVNAKACEIADATINSRASTMGSILIVLIVIFIAIYMFTWTYGTPTIIKNILSPTRILLAPNQISKQWSYIPYYVIAGIIAIIVHTGFA